MIAQPWAKDAQNANTVYRIITCFSYVRALRADYTKEQHNILVTYPVAFIYLFSYFYIYKIEILRAQVLVLLF